MNKMVENKLKFVVPIVHQLKIKQNRGINKNQVSVKKFNASAALMIPIHQRMDNFMMQSK
jgi:hypothetical protein